MSVVKKGRVLSGVHFMLGNYAVVEGALAVGCDYFAGYPITPASEILELMSKRLPEVGGIFVQADLVLFNPKTIIDKNSYLELKIYPEGVKMFWVKGK